MHILIVDDINDNRVLLRAILESRGYQVNEAANGLEAIDQVRLQTPDLIISDILMPEMDGFTLCRALKTMSILREVPLIFYTATYLDPEDEALGMALGASIYIHKPTDPLQLLKHIEDILQSGRSPALSAGSAIQEGVELEALHQERLAQKLDKKIKDVNWLRQQQSQILASTVEGIINFDQEGKLILVNQATAKLLGYEVDELLGKPFQQLLHEQESNCQSKNEYKTIRDQIKNCLIDQHHLQQIEDKFCRKDGSSIPVEYSCAPMIIDSTSNGAVVIFRDISERKRTEEKMHTLTQAIEQSPVSVIVTDLKANIEYVNKAFEKITGYSKDEVIGKNPRLLNSRKTPAKLYKNMWKTILSGRPWKGEIQNRKKNGEIFWESAHIAPVMDNSGNIKHYLGVKEDISFRKLQDEKILHQAHYDTLTDLPNRFLSLDRLDQLINEAMRKNNRIAVLFLDLDDFKKVNDTLGHETGDKVLIEAANRLQSEVRNIDTVGRLGGDEFVIILSGITLISDATAIAEKLVNRFRKAFEIDDRDLLLTASIGISIYPEDGNTSSILLRCADTAMYHSKEHGRNTYSYFTDIMNKDVSRRLMLEEQMHNALDRGELHVLYQPQIDIKKRLIYGIEALLEWKTPSLGEVHPDEFIPIAERTSLIIPIGQFIFQEALANLSNWQKLFNPQLKMAINLSPRQFRDPELVSYIEFTLNKYGISAESLELEITEGVLMSGYSYIDKALSELNQLNVGITMDDFGTGYSSLSYLRQYPFDVVKIDKSFVRDITHDKADLELVNASIDMSHGLGLKIVAEGVETEQQLDLLARKNCDYAQGYLFSKPVQADKISKLLEADLKKQNSFNG